MARGRRAWALGPLTPALLIAAAACGPREAAPNGKPSAQVVTPLAPSAKVAVPRAPSAPSAQAAASSAPSAALASPLPAVRVPRGGALYALMCAVCHGAAGEGYKADRAPALAHPDFIGTVSDDFLRKAILEGRKATTMSAWGKDRGGPLGPEDTDDLIAFMRSWQKPPAIALDESPLRGDVARGKPLFERECTRCHGAGGFGGQYIQLADANLLATSSDGFLRHGIARGRPGTPMEGYGAKLSKQDIDDLIVFIRDAGQQIAKAFAPPPPQQPVPLGQVVRNPKGPKPTGFKPHPGTTKADQIHFQLASGARMVLLDSRAPSDYINEHIAGAVSVPFYDPEPYFARLPKNTWLVCYCACPHAESKALAQKLVDAGFPFVTVLDEGLGFWKMKGYPVRTGREP